MRWESNRQCSETDRSSGGDADMVEPATERTKVIAQYEEMRYGMFILFTMNTFLDRPFWEAMSGPLPGPDRYAPEELDVNQWVKEAQRGGMRYAVLTAKHYLGFALRDSDCTDYDVSSSRCPTDVVAEFVASCRRHGLAPGLYITHWARMLPIGETEE